MHTTLDFSSLPDEVTDYAFDQYTDRLNGPELEDALENTFGDEPVSMDYEKQTATIHQTVITQILQEAMAEKIRDIEYEVKHDERNDYEHGEVQNMRKLLDAIFSQEKHVTVPVEPLNYVLEEVGNDVLDWFDGDVAEEAAGHVSILYEALGESEEADFYRDYTN